eukprot:360675-Chlamydomonas_euryale.AAC.7
MSKGSVSLSITPTVNQQIGFPVPDRTGTPVVRTTGVRPDRTDRDVRLDGRPIVRPSIGRTN